MIVETKMVDGVPRKIHKIVVHKFFLGDVEDPDIYAAEPLFKWEQSEAGQYVMTHAVETPIWQRHTDISSYSIQYSIVAKLYEEDVTYFTLRWK